MLLLIAILSRVLLVLCINSLLDNFTDNFCLCYESYGKKLLNISIVVIGLHSTCLELVLCFVFPNFWMIF